MSTNMCFRICPYYECSGPATVLKTDQCLQMPLFALVSTRTSKRSHRCLASLQKRLRLAYRIDRDSANGNTLQDFQSAGIQKNDMTWSTHGAPIGRAGDHGSYISPLLSYKDYTVDTLIHAAFSLTPSQNGPTPEETALALQKPYRPLFLGRKTCLPSAYLFQGLDTESQSPLQALLSLPALPETEPTVRLLWSRGETAGAPDDLVPSKTYRLSDERHFQSGPHKGFRWVSEASIDAARLPSKSTAPVC